MFISWPQVVFNCVCIYIHHIFLSIHLTWHLDCICILAIVNTTAVNTELHVSFQIAVFHFFVDNKLKVELMDCKFYTLVFEKTLYCFPYCLHQFTFPATVYGVPFLCILFSICCRLYIMASILTSVVHLIAVLILIPP